MRNIRRNMCSSLYFVVWSLFDIVKFISKTFDIQCILLFYYILITLIKIVGSQTIYSPKYFICYLMMMFARLPQI